MKKYSKEPLKNVVSSRNLHTSSEKRELATKTYQEKIRRGAMSVLQPKCANCSSKHVFQRFPNYALIVLMIVVLISIIIPLRPSSMTYAASATQTWDFATSSDFTFDSNLAEVTGGLTQLKANLGQEWTQVGSSSTNFENVPDIFSLAVDPQANVFVGTRDETNGNVDVFRSTDNGTNWSKIADGANDITNNPSAITRIISDRNNPANVYFIAFRGGPQAYDLYRYNSSNSPTLTLLRDSVNSFNSNVQYSDVATDSSNNVYLLNNNNVYKSTDRGATWSKVGDQTTNFSSNATLSSLRIDSSDRIYAVSENGSVFRSTDAGVTWTSRATNQWNFSLTWDPMSVTFDSSNNIYAVVENTIYRSTDGGSTWSSFATGAVQFGGASNINSIHFSTGGSIFVNTGDIWKSSDSGSNWTRVARASTNFGNINILTAAIDTNNYMFVGTFGSSGNVYRTSLYSVNKPTVTAALGYSFATISAFTVTEGSGSAGTIQYQISHNGSTWYYYDGTSWVTASGFAQSNTASQVNSNIATFATQVGVGKLFFRAYLNSSGSQQPKIDTITVSLDQPQFYINPSTGSNSNNGRSQSTPWKTLTYALSQVGSSDTINLLSGTYNTSSGETFPLSIGQNVTLQSVSGAASTTIEVPTNASSGINLSASVSNVTINGFTIKAAGTGTVTVQMQDFRAAGSSGITIANNIISCENAGNIGIEFGPASGTIRNNIIRNCPNNNGVNLTQGGDSTPPSLTVNVYNNTLWNNKTAIGVDNALSGKNPSVTIKNNIIANDGDGTGMTKSGTVTVSNSYNNFYNNGTNFGGGTSAGTGDISQNPLFVSTTSGSENFRLQSTSPSIDVGTTLADVTTDILGSTRPYGSAYDQGAYENDNRTPTISSQSPASGATNVAQDANISFRLTDADSGINTSSITVTVGGTSVTPTVTTVTAPTTYDVTYDPPTNFTAGSTVTVAVTGSDQWSTPNSLSTSWSFTVIGGTTTETPSYGGGSGSSSSSGPATTPSTQTTTQSEDATETTEIPTEITPATTLQKPTIITPEEEKFNQVIDTTEEIQRTVETPFETDTLQKTQAAYRLIRNTRVEQRKFIYTPFKEILTYLVEDTDLKIQVKPEIADEKMSLNITDASLKNILDSITVKLTDTEWGISEGIIILAKNDYFDNQYYKKIDPNTEIVAKIDTPWIQIITTYSAQCNNGILDSGEACDDGNSINEDGCSSECKVETVDYCGKITDIQNATKILKTSKATIGSHLVYSSFTDITSKLGKISGVEIIVSKKAEKKVEGYLRSIKSASMTSMLDAITSENNLVWGITKDSIVIAEKSEFESKKYIDLSAKDLSLLECSEIILDTPSEEGDENQDEGNTDEEQEEEPAEELPTEEPTEELPEEVVIEETTQEVVEEESGEEVVVVAGGSPETTEVAESDAEPEILETTENIVAALGGVEEPTTSTPETEEVHQSGSDIDPTTEEEATNSVAGGSPEPTISSTTSECTTQNGNIDSDQDGLSDESECYIGTGKNNNDTDNDGVTDGEEFLDYHSDPLDAEDVPEFLQETIDYIIPYFTNLRDGETIADATPLFQGAGHPKTAIQLILSDNSENQTTLGKTSMSDQGKFFFETQTALQDGTYMIAIEQYDPNTGEKLNESKKITFHINTTIDISIPKIVKLSGKQIIAGRRLNIEDIRPKLTGMGDHGNVIVIHWQSAIFASTLIADSVEGTFYGVAPKDLELGDHTVWAYAIRPSDNVRSADIKVDFVIEKPSSSKEIQKTSIGFVLILLVVGASVLLKKITTGNSQYKEGHRK